jgi:PKD repeat protein
MCVLLCSLLLLAACGLQADVLLQQDFESGLGDWTVDNGIWEVGTPTVGPMAAHQGTQCAAVGMDGNYPSGGSSRLISPEFAVPPRVPGQEVWLRFYILYRYQSFDSTWLQVRTKSWDGTWGSWGYAAIGGSASSSVGGVDDYAHTSDWSLEAADLTSYAGNTIQLAFLHGDCAGCSGGTDWGAYLDEIVVTAGFPVFHEPEGFEGGWGDWHSDYGTWQIGVPTIGPGSAHSGTQVAGSYLAHAQDWWAADSMLVSPTVRLPSVDAGKTITLRVWEWWSYPGGTGSAFGGHISVLDEGSGAWSAWTALTWSPGHATASSSGWLQNSADLTAYAGKAARLGFGRGANADNVNIYYIDDIELELPLAADFVGVPLVHVAPVAVEFTDTSVGGPTTWAWDFGDRGSSTLQNPSHLYTAPGSYTVSLTVGKDAETDTETKTDYITVLTPVAAAFSASPTSGTAPLPVSFTDASTGNPTTWAWTFGDGGASVLQNPAHEYTTPGKYSVSLTASMTNGSDTETKDDYITVYFPDVDSTHWACDEVMACLDANAVKGYDDGLYHPEWTVARDQMAVYIARALVSPSGDAAIPDPEPPPSFSDVPPTHWAYKHIEYAVSQNVVKGYEDGTYLPGATVDRGTMAVYIARAMVAPGGDAAIPDPVPPATFPDVPDTYWSYKQVEYCVGQGVVKGYDDSNYHPEYPVTRDQMAVYIAKAFGLL